MNYFYVGFGLGLLLALICLIWQVTKRRKMKKANEAEIAKLRTMLTDRMDLEAEGVAKLKNTIEELRMQNENLRITNAHLLQKPGRAEIQRLDIYQMAIDRLTVSTPGFGAAWQSALSEAQNDFTDVYTGTKPFWKRIIPHRAEPKMVEQKEITDGQSN